MHALLYVDCSFCDLSICFSSHWFTNRPALFRKAELCWLHGRMISCEMYCAFLQRQGRRHVFLTLFMFCCWSFNLKCSILVFLHGLVFRRFRRLHLLYLFLVFAICRFAFCLNFDLQIAPGSVVEKPNFAINIIVFHFAKCILLFCGGWAVDRFYSLLAFMVSMLRFQIFNFRVSYGFEFRRSMRPFCMPLFWFYDLSACVSLFWCTNRPGFFGWDRPNFAVCIFGCHFTKCVVQSFRGCAGDCF